MTSSPCATGSEPLLFVVDDDHDTRGNLRDILELDGYRIVEAGSAAQLFQYSAWHEVSLILLDRKLSDGDAQHLLPEIKRLAPHAGVIVITGHADLSGAVTALREGVSDYILKPINPDVLRSSIRRELQRLVYTRRMHALFDNALDGFIIFGADQVILEANPAARKMLKLSAEELCGRRIDSLLVTNPDDDTAETATLFSEPNQATECRLRRGDGAIIDVEHRTAFDFSPGVSAVSLRDITERKRAEERALQSERLAAIGETMTALVHESRNALQRSFACLEMLACEVEDRPEALDLIARTQRAQNQLRQLYEEVRQWAAPIKLQREKADLSIVWREAWQQVAAVYAGKQLSLVEDLTCLPICRVDAAKLGQVFRNIFENATEVSPDNGQVTLHCHNGSASGKSEIHIAIRDAGPGLSDEQQQHMFEPFFTTKTKGTGLGLSITQRIIQAHDGQIRAASPGGAQIEIVLPKGSGV